MQFARLAMTGVGGSSGATLFTATSKTIVRTMDLCYSGGSSGYYLVKVNDTGSDTTNLIWYLALINPSTYATYEQSYPGGGQNLTGYTAQWRGGLVLNSGDYLYAYASTYAIHTITVCGVTGV